MCAHYDLKPHGKFDAVYTYTYIYIYTRVCAYIRIDIYVYCILTVEVSLNNL